MTTRNEGKPLDFTKVEALRRHMLLTMSDMAELVGVSRVTYHGWVQGRKLREANDIKMRALLRQMMVLVRDQGWPPPDVIGAEQKERKERLVAALQQL